MNFLTTPNKVYRPSPCWWQFVLWGLSVVFEGFIAIPEMNTSCRWTLISLSNNEPITTLTFPTDTSWESIYTVWILSTWTWWDSLSNSTARSTCKHQSVWLGTLLVMLSATQLCQFTILWARERITPYSPKLTDSECIKGVEIYFVVCSHCCTVGMKMIMNAKKELFLLKHLQQKISDTHV